MKRNRTSSQSLAIGKAIAAHNAAKESRRINSQMTREFGAPALREFQGNCRQEEQTKIQEFLENNKDNTESFQELPYANGYRVSNNPY